REPHVIATNGSLENVRHLLSKNVQIALMQESSVRSDQVAVVAPLFYEAIHILVPKESEIQHVVELVGKRIMMGTIDSGTHQAATSLLKHFDITPEKITLVESDWTHTDRLSDADVVIAVTKVGQQGIAELLRDERYRLLSIDNAAELAQKMPMFRLFEMPGKAYGSATKPAILTLATTALLVVRKDAPARLVEECLNAIYNGMPAAEGLIGRDLAANWQGLPYHESARKFFATSLGTP
ncbi:MAG TPA: TAXI family TRAP transporter solute-binding subunit, partial [Pirellula sp.]|nr:TAXI family TRAP transporter solute-binding subunit [Pirellula sp.]